MSAYKVLGADRQSHHGGTGTWTPGTPRSVTGTLVACRRGIHYCRHDQLVRWLGPTIWTFEDLTPDETLDGGDKMVTRRGCVHEQLATWNETTARLFAADCAEAVVTLIPEAHREPFLTVITAARQYARGEIGDAARDAAWDAAAAAVGDAARDAAWAAAWAAARDAAWAAAWAAARDAARAAAWAAARAAAWAAAWAAARDAQSKLLFDYLEGRAA